MTDRKPCLAVAEPAFSKINKETGGAVILATTASRPGARNQVLLKSTLIQMVKLWYRQSSLLLSKGSEWAVFGLLTLLN
jgi:hypothetical protein